MYSRKVEKELDAKALDDWQAREAEELAGTELPVTRDDFELSFQAWLGYVPQRFWPFVATWVAAIRRNARVQLSASSQKAIRGMMRRDVDETTSMLWDAKPAVIEAWIKWYPQWIVGLIAERAKDDPWFLLPAEEHFKVKLLVRQAAERDKKQRSRDVLLGDELFRYVLSRGGQVNWRPGLIAAEMREDTRGRRVVKDRVIAMAQALDRLDVAHFRYRDNGQPWAFRLTVDAIELVHAKKIT